MASEINNNNRSIYNLPYQYTIKAKVMFGRKIMRYKQWEMDHISTFIQTHANGGAILDMGCSTGHMVEILSNHFGVNQIHGDFKLNDDSPCIDKGHPDSRYNDVDGGRSDMGAYGGKYGAWNN